jgi:DNA gyrase inhibitor GyrI
MHAQHAKTGPIALLTVVAAGAGVARWLDVSTRILTRRRRRTSGVVLGLSALAGAALVRWQLQRLFTDEPPYDVERRDLEFEVRRYPVLEVARTAVSGTWAEALNEGFDRLASFLFGKNVVRDPNTLAAGTDHTPKKLPMTTPVLASREGSHHVVAFVMPKGESSKTLPVPRDPRVTVEPLASRRVAVLRFHGTYSADTIRHKQEELFELVESAGLVPASDPVFAGYDPPWTLPFLRRVEVWLPIEG